MLLLVNKVYFSPLVGKFILKKAKQFFMYYNLDMSPLSNMWFVNIFFQLVACLFTLLTVSFVRAKVFDFDKVQFIDYFSYELCFWCRV